MANTKLYSKNICEYAYISIYHVLNIQLVFMLSRFMLTLAAIYHECWDSLHAQGQINFPLQFELLESAVQSIRTTTGQIGSGPFFPQNFFSRY